VLAVELEGKGHHGVLICAALVGICAGGGLFGCGADGNFDLEAVTEGIFAAVFGFVTGVVDI